MELVIVDRNSSRYHADSILKSNVRTRISDVSLDRSSTLVRTLSREVETDSRNRREIESAGRGQCVVIERKTRNDQWSSC